MREEIKTFFRELDSLCCSDSNCWIAGPRMGQHTNGGCHCLDQIGDFASTRKIKKAFGLFQKLVGKLSLELAKVDKF